MENTKRKHDNTMNDMTHRALFSTQNGVIFQGTIITQRFAHKVRALLRTASFLGISADRILLESNEVREKLVCSELGLAWLEDVKGSDAFNPLTKRFVEIKAPTNGENGINVGELSEDIVLRKSAEDHIFVEFYPSGVIRKAILVRPEKILPRYRLWLKEGKTRGQKVRWSWVEENGVYLIQEGIRTSNQL